MPESKVISLDKRALDEEKSFFEQLLQEGARKLLHAAIENEVMDYIQFHKDRRDENGQRLVVRNGHLPEREIISGIGPIKVVWSLKHAVKYWEFDRFQTLAITGNVITKVITFGAVRSNPRLSDRFPYRSIGKFDFSGQKAAKTRP
jgi:hypothetical protein